MKVSIWIFRFIAVLIPILFFVGLELTLKAVGFGKVTPLFIENPAAPHYLLPKPDVVQRYFSSDALAPNVTIEPNFFLKDKPQGALRLVVQGGSTAAGFPYGLSTSIAGMLDYRLKQSFPERHVEVINTALSAVNSYTLLDFAEEIIVQQPDAILIYAGHNEYLGLLGVGSNYTAANSRGATLLFLKLQEFRTFQLLQAAYDWLFQPEITQATQNSRTVMAKVAKHKNIPVGSPLFDAGVEQFRGNLALLLSKYQQAGIPVFISTIASNLKDQPPFESQPITADAIAEQFHSSEHHEWATLRQSLVASGLVAETDFNQAQQSATLLDKASMQTFIQQVNSGHFEGGDKQSFSIESLIWLSIMAELNSAHAHYWLGHIALDQGLVALAKTHLLAARQFDLLRFRAPVEMNATIRDLAKTYDAYLVDAELALEQAAPDGLIGRSLMIEHLHPTPQGYFEIADAFYQALVTSPVLMPVPNVISRQQAQADMPLLPAEVYWGEAKIAGLLADYPFTKTPQEVQLPPQKNVHDKIGFAAHQKQIGWLQLAQETLNVAKRSGDKSLFLTTTALIADALPYDSQKNFEAGVSFIQAKQAAKGIRFLQRVLIEDPNNINALLALAHAYAELNQLAKTMSYLQQVLAIDPQNATALQNLPGLKKALGQ